jgi:DNA mismatch repair protein MutS
MMLDAVTARNLELVAPVFADAPEATLISAIDYTKTSMGARLLKSWILRPALHAAVIEARWDAVEELSSNIIERDKIVRELAAIQDMERLLGRVALGTASPRDLGGMRTSIAPLPSLRILLDGCRAERFRELWEETDELVDLRRLLEAALVDSPPLATADGGIIREGYHAELDELRRLSHSGKQTIAQMEARERQATGIGSLKIKFNNVFGYYIEVSKANLPLVPGRFERKQTLVNAERFTTPELKEYERKVLDAEDRIRQIELELFAGLRTKVGEQAARIRRTAAAVAELDVLANFAAIASERDYCRPAIANDGIFEVQAGRHPVLEQLAESLDGERFVPNDLFMNAESDRILIITGPNMGGKSTYLRQAALISILAQMGSFVPAASARLPLWDRIYTRIGASDNLARGRSTFMVEMTETAVILNTAGPKSLVILDEIGRGTATFDGLSIAWAVVEYLHSQPGIKALFATHYHELTELAEHLPGVKNRHVSVKESDGNIVFLRRVEPGSADRSYGIEVARLAGLPNEVIERARDVLSQHEQSEHRLTDTLAVAGADGSVGAGNYQLTLFTPAEHALRERLANLNIEELKPLDALNFLAELKKNIGTDSGP